jgi:hypothetical protein
MGGSFPKIELYGSGEPTFIIKCGDAYYVTQGAAAFENVKTTNDDEREDVAAVANSFQQIRSGTTPCEAVMVPKSYNLASRQATNRK